MGKVVKRKVGFFPKRPAEMPEADDQLVDEVDAEGESTGFTPKAVFSREEFLAYEHLKDWINDQRTVLNQVRLKCAISYNMYRGDQPLAIENGNIVRVVADPSYVSFVNNRIRSLVDMSTNRLTSNQPFPSVDPLDSQSADDSLLAETANACLEYLYTNERLDLIVRNWFQAAMLYGFSFLQIYKKDEKDICTKLVLPTDIIYQSGLQMSGAFPLDASPYVAVTHIEARQNLAQQYEDAAQAIFDAENNIDTDGSYRQYMTPTEISQNSGWRTYNVEVEEIFVKPQTIFVRDEKSKKVIAVEFKNGWYIKHIPGADLILESHDLDREMLETGHYPFAAFQLDGVPNNFEQQGIPERIADTAVGANILDNALLQSAIVRSYTMWVSALENGLEADEFVVGHNRVIRPSLSTGEEALAPKIVEHPPLDTTVVEYSKKLESDMQSMVNVTPSDMAQQTGSLRTLGAQMQMQEAVGVMIRGQVVHAASALMDFAQLLLSFVSLNWTPDEVLEIAGFTDEYVQDPSFNEELLGIFEVGGVSLKIDPNAIAFRSKALAREEANQAADRGILTPEDAYSLGEYGGEPAFAAETSAAKRYHAWLNRQLMKADQLPPEKLKQLLDKSLLDAYNIPVAIRARQLLVQNPRFHDLTLASQKAILASLVQLQERDQILAQAQQLVAKGAMQQSQSPQAAVEGSVAAQ